MRTDGSGFTDDVVVSHPGSMDHGLTSGDATLTDEQRAELVDALRADGSGAIADAVAECDSATCGACNALYDMEVRDREEEALAATPQRPVVKRPADSAAKAAWVDHVVSLGVDRDTVTGGSKHWDDEAQDYVAAPSLSKDELVELADRLGG